MRPTARLLNVELVERIIAEARDILQKLGLEIHNDELVSLLSDHGAKFDRDKNRVHIPGDMVDKALGTVPESFKLYDVLGNETHDLSGDRIHFTPGSSAIAFLEHETNKARPPTTDDYIQYAKLVSCLESIASQSTAFIPTDVHPDISDSYRLYLSLLYGEKPVVTGAFSIDAFTIMRDLLLTVRGSQESLATKPLSVFSCCATAPLKWSEVTSHSLVDCARCSIPVELISMPLAGFTAPVTLVGSLVLHTAEILSGIVFGQLVNPGTPMLYGGSPAIFDMRFETTPMGAIETMMLDCAYNEIGKHLGLPTQAYISLSDAKLLDAQAGLETAMGATLAALSGINNISGPGMLDFENSFSLEKLVLDNEICGMTLRLVKGIEPQDDFPALPRFEELLRDQHLLISKHTRRHLKNEHYFPSPTIDRANRARWEEEGGRTLGDRAHAEVLTHLTEYQPSRLSVDIKDALSKRMTTETKRFGMDRLPNTQCE